MSSKLCEEIDLMSNGSSCEPLEERLGHLRERVAVLEYRFACLQDVAESKKKKASRRVQPTLISSGEDAVPRPLKRTKCLKDGFELTAEETDALLALSTKVDE